MTDEIHHGEKQVRIERNDYGPVQVPPLGGWQPSMTVSVVVPAHGGQEKLDLVLASLSAQTYPSGLFDVIVVDDGSEPGLELRGPRPERTSIIATREGGWGIADALASGVEAASGDVVLRLDADVVVNRFHVESHARWHHQADYLTVLGTILLVDTDAAHLDADGVRSAVDDERAHELFADCEIAESWAKELIDRYEGLKTLESRAYSVANGASISFPRALFDEAGGMNPDMLLGEDTELGYRLALRGAVFVPEKQATGWHLGLSTTMQRREESRRFRGPFFANRIPMLRYLRKNPNAVWTVPYVDVVVDADGRDFESVCATVDTAMSGSLSDVGVTLLGAWASIPAGRHALLDDPLLDLRLLEEAYGSDGRVRFAENLEETSAPSPFRLTVPAGTAIGYDAVKAITDLAEERCVGIVSVVLSGHDAASPVRLERTAAVARALRLRMDGERTEELVDEIWGVWWADGDEWFGVPAQGGRDIISAAELRKEVERLRMENARLEESREKQERRAEHWKQNTYNARNRVAKWEKAAANWESKASKWERLAERAARRPSRRPLLKRVRSRIARMLRG